MNSNFQTTPYYNESVRGGNWYLGLSLLPFYREISNRSTITLIACLDNQSAKIMKQYILPVKPKKILQKYKCKDRVLLLQ